MIAGPRHTNQRVTLTFTAPERRTYLIKKTYLTKLRLDAAQQWGTPKWVATLAMILMSSSLGCLFVLRTVFEKMIIVGIICYLVALNYVWIAILAAVAAVLYNSVFIINTLVHKYSIGNIKVKGRAATLQVLRDKRALDVVGKLKETVASYILTRGGSLNPWTLAESISDTVSMSLIIYFFLSGAGAINSIWEWAVWTSFFVYMIGDIVCLGLPQSIFHVAAPTVTPDWHSSLVMQMISISLSFGLVSSIFMRLRRSVLEEETFHGTLANLADYIGKVAAEDLGQIVIVDCGVAPGENVDSRNQFSGIDATERRDVEHRNLVASIEEQLRVAQK